MTSSHSYPQSLTLSSFVIWSLFRSHLLVLEMIFAVTSLNLLLWFMLNTSLCSVTLYQPSSRTKYAVVIKLDKHWACFFCCCRWGDVASIARIPVAMWQGDDSSLSPGLICHMSSLGNNKEDAILHPVWLQINKEGEVWFFFFTIRRHVKVNSTVLFLGSCAD